LNIHFLTPLPAHFRDINALNLLPARLGSIAAAGYHCLTAYCDYQYAEYQFFILKKIGYKRRLTTGATGFFY
jgi:hypothetical protein